MVECLGEFSPDAGLLFSFVQGVGVPWVYLVDLCAEVVAVQGYPGDCPG